MPPVAWLLELDPDLIAFQGLAIQAGNGGTCFVAFHFNQAGTTAFTSEYV